MPRRIPFWIVGLLVALVGCQSSASAEPSGDPAEEAQARVELTITGGDQPGEYEALLVDTGCNVDEFGGDAFEVASDTIEGTEGFEGIDISVFDAEEARSGGTENFAMVLSLAGGAEPEMAPAEGVGTGTLVLEEHEVEETATVTVAGTMDDGSGATVRVECLVLRSF
jgi:hypothetical protein